MRPTIGISSGDPAGIGLEVVLKALPEVLDQAHWILFTDEPAFERHYVRFGAGIPTIWLPESDRSPASFEGGRGLSLIEVPGAHCPIPWGDQDPAAGQRALSYLTAASDMALKGQLDGVVTAPVSKAAIGGGFVGQTDFLAQRAGVESFAMAFFTPTFKVVLATVHLSLREALNRLTTAVYVDLIRLTHREFRRLGLEEPVIAVAGINPHAGENGIFGREELDILEPAIRICASDGIRVSGPHSADSLYYRAHTGEFDVVLAPYHDQGLAPVKLIAHGTSTNVTLGLPYVRTSPDHGTAFSIAGKGLAESSGMLSALRCALDLCSRSSNLSH